MSAKLWYAAITFNLFNTEIICEVKKKYKIVISDKI